MRNLDQSVGLKDGATAHRCSGSPQSSLRVHGVDALYLENIELYRGNPRGGVESDT